MATARAQSRSRQPVRRVRWDRVSRVGLLVVLVVILGLYIAPARSYFSTRNEARARAAAVESLRKENRRLRARKAALATPGTLEREARKQGMVRPGERAFAVSGLPKGG